MLVRFGPSHFLLLLAGAFGADTSAQGSHPFAGKNCAARASSVVESGNFRSSATGKLDFFFQPNGSVKVKWTSDSSGRVQGGEIEYRFVGLEDKYHVWRSDRGGSVHIDARAASGTGRFNVIVVQFSQFTCN